jgi:hypothetical protein
MYLLCILAILLSILMYSFIPSREGMDNDCTSLAYENQKRMDDLETKFKDVSTVIDKINTLDSQLQAQKTQLDSALNMKLS